MYDPFNPKPGDLSIQYERENGNDVHDTVSRAIRDAYIAGYWAGYAKARNDAEDQK